MVLAEPLNVKIATILAQYISGTKLVTYVAATADVLNDYISGEISWDEAAQELREGLAPVVGEDKVEDLLAQLKAIADEYRFAMRAARKLRRRRGGLGALTGL